MQLTKFTHSCVRFDDGERSLVIDPGVFSETAEALDGAQAILITHQHPDHIDVAAVSAALRANPRLRVWGPAPLAGLLAEFGEQVVTVGPAESFDATGFAVRTFGGQHALIHPAIPVVPNVGYLIDGVFHPGDSFTVPSAEVTTLLLPFNAPWSKASEVIDFAIAVRAPRVHQIHESLVTPTYRGIVQPQIESIAGPFGVRFEWLEARQSVTAGARARSG